MSTPEPNKKRDYSRYDQMSTSELEQLLRLDFQAAEGGDSDLDAILYISDLLAKLGMMESGMSILSNPKTALLGPILGCVWYGTPYFAIMILSALQGVSSETLEAAHVDGAGCVTRLFQVIIPAIKPTILVTLLLMGLGVLNFMFW